MSALLRIFRAAIGLFRRHQLERQMDEEVRSYLSMEKGEAAPDSHSELLRAKESIRDSRSEFMFDALGQDIRQAMRMLLHDKGWAVVAVLTLALGIAPLTALFSLIDRVYAPIPVNKPEELVFSNHENLARYAFLRDHSSTLAGLIAYDRDDRSGNRVEVVADGKLGAANVEYVSGNYYSVLGVSLLRGRAILNDDDQVSSTPVVMISELYWERGFGRRANVIGETIQLQNRSFTIIGIWPQDFVDVRGDISRSNNNAPVRPDIMIPLAHHPRPRNLEIVGRVKPGVTLAQVNSEKASLLRADDPQSPVSKFTKRHYGIFGFADEFQKYPVDYVLTTLLCIGFLGAPLFLSCTNIATFLLSRSEDRRVEIALRLSLGASRGRLIRQLLAESVVLAAFAALAAMMFTYWWTRILANPPFTDYGNLPMNWTAFLFVVVLVFPVGIGCGLLPATDATRNVAHLMRTFGAHFSRSKSTRTRNLITVQVALSFFGLFCVGLMVRAVQRMHSAQVGYTIDNIVTFNIDPNAGRVRYGKDRMKVLYEDVVSTLSAIPGVQSVAFSDQSILNESNATTTLHVLDPDRRLQTTNAILMAVDPRFFRTMGLTFQLGEPFGTNDTGPAQSAVINETLARSLFPGRNPIGLRFGRDSRSLESLEVVGIVADKKASSEASVLYVRDVCCPGPKTFEVKVAGSPVAILPAIRSALHNVAPDLQVSRLSAAKADSEASYQANDAPWRSILTYYAGLATFLVITGVFGLMSHSVARRTREIGIRMAIGAEPRQVLKTVIQEAVGMVIPGLIVGLAATLIAGRLMTRYLEGYAPIDPLVIASSIVLMLLIASIAGYWPARRASHVEPLVALRHD